MRRRRISPERRRRAVARRRRRLRGFLRLAALFTVVALAAYVGATVANAADDPATLSERSYTVRRGDTLWTIAESHYDLELDPRKIVYAIQRRNGLDGAGLVPGQVLTLPPPGQV